MIGEALEFEFFRHALIAGLLTSIACGVIGAFVVVKQISSISGGLSHAALGGVGLGCFLGFDPTFGALLFCVGASLLIGFMYFQQRESLDTLVAVVWSVGMALGILLISITSGTKPDLGSYLFGNILLVPVKYLLFTAAFDIAVLVIVVFLFKELQAVSFDEEFATVKGLNVRQVFYLLLMLIAVAVVILIRVVGVVMMIALLTIPTVISRHWLKNLRGIIVLCVCVVAFANTCGLFLSLWLSETISKDLPTGPMIVLSLICLYCLSSLVIFLRNKQFDSGIEFRESD